MKTQSVLLASTIAGLIGLASLSVSADDVAKNGAKPETCEKGGFHKAHKKGGLKKAFAELNLSDEQKNKLQNLRQQKRAGTITRETFKSEMAGILTPEQNSKMEQIRSQRGERKHRGMHGKGKGGMRAKMETLNLSDEQKTQMQTLRKESRDTFMAKIQTILTPEQFAKFQEFKKR